jgi:hypothetical protein
MWIILVVVFLLVACLFFNIVIQLRIENEVFVFIRYIFLKYRIYPKSVKELPKDERPPKKPTAQKKKEKVKVKYKETFETLFDIINSSKEWLKKLFRKIAIDNLLIEITIGGDDPAEIACEYGKTNAYVYSIMGVLQNILNIKGHKIDIKFDYDKKETTFKVFCDFKIRLITLAIIIIAITLKYFKMTMKKEEKVYE